MAILTDNEKKELLQDASSADRRLDFRQMDARNTQLTPSEFIEFLDWINKLHGTRAREHEPIKGTHFLM